MLLLRNPTTTVIYQLACFARMSSSSQSTSVRLSNGCSTYRFTCDDGGRSSHHARLLTVLCISSEARYAAGGSQSRAL